MEGEVFGPYRLDRLIGSGGMGEVFRAHDTVRNRVVALKRLPRQLAVDAEYLARASFLFDLKILLGTVAPVVLGKGVRA